MATSSSCNLTREQVSAGRKSRIKAVVATLACTLIPAGLGSLVHVGWAVTFAVLGLAADAIYFRRNESLACVLTLAALGSLAHVGWAIMFAAVGFASDVILFRGKE